MSFFHIFAAALLLLLSSSQAHAAGGSVSGIVTVKGTPPRAGVLQVANNQDVCHKTVPDETYVISRNKEVRYSVVSIEGASGKGSPGTLTLDNKGCCFVPHVQAALTGSSVTVINSDPALHNANLKKDGNTIINVALPTQGMKITKQAVLKDAGVVEVKCGVHKWMKGYIVVFEHPYFAVTDESGRFTIPNIPAGKYKIKVWHEGFGSQARDITIKDGGKSTADFALSKK
ncbi:MAG: carboxypeptidase regulatory-like domain-containing protein [Armatimonadetes bacterium]|nr:carboxypeptidase regulatory-like domain-containing protein [Armatimonadota bacterium]